MSDGVLSPAMSDALISQRDAKRASAYQRHVRELEDKLKRLAIDVHRLGLPAGTWTDCSIEHLVPARRLLVINTERPRVRTCGRAIYKEVKEGPYGKMFMATLPNGQPFCSAVGIEHRPRVEKRTDPKTKKTTKVTVVDTIFALARTPSEFVRHLHHEMALEALYGMTEEFEYLVRAYA